MHCQVSKNVSQICHKFDFLLQPTAQKTRIQLMYGMMNIHKWIGEMWVSHMCGCTHTLHNVGRPRAVYLHIGTSGETKSELQCVM